MYLYIEKPSREHVIKLGTYSVLAKEIASEFYRRHLLRVAHQRKYPCPFKSK